MCRTVDDMSILHGSTRNGIDNCVGIVRRYVDRFEADVVCMLATESWVAMTWICGWYDHPRIWHTRRTVGHPQIWARVFVVDCQQFRVVMWHFRGSFFCQCLLKMLAIWSMVASWLCPMCAYGVEGTCCSRTRMSLVVASMAMLVGD